MKNQKPESLADLRKNIAALQQEINAVGAAGLPAAQVEAAIRVELNQAVDCFQRIQTAVATCLSEGRPETLDHLIGYEPEKGAASRLALGAALAVYGVDRFLDEAQTQASQPPGLRLSATERESRLHDCLQALYDLELSEERVVEETGTSRRPDCNAAAVLGLPFATAQQAGLIGE